MLQLTTQERTMFKIENYKFSTTQAGRKTTMYFHDGINGGRIKRSTSAGGAGGQVIYQAGCKRVFMNFHESLRISGLGEDRVQIDVVEKIQKVYRMLIAGNADNRTKLLYSLQPKIGMRVFEMYGTRAHGSAGTVTLFDPDATRVNILNMMFDDNMVSV